MDELLQKYLEAREAYRIANDNLLAGMEKAGITKLDVSSGGYIRLVEQKVNKYVGWFGRNNIKEDKPE